MKKILFVLFIFVMGISVFAQSNDTPLRTNFPPYPYMAPWGSSPTEVKRLIVNIDHPYKQSIPPTFESYDRVEYHVDSYVKFIYHFESGKLNMITRILTDERADGDHYVRSLDLPLKDRVQDGGFLTYYREAYNNGEVVLAWDESKGDISLQSNYRYLFAIIRSPEKVESDAQQNPNFVTDYILSLHYQYYKERLEYAPPAPEPKPEPKVEPTTEFAPFASRISARVVNSIVLITWTDSPSFEDATYQIYRDTKELTGSTGTLVGEVETGTQEFADVPGSGSFYYAVFIRDGGELYKYPIPFRNITMSAKVVE